MKLFVFCIGGSYGGANVELHDIRFAIGETAEACHAEIRRQWWGDPASLHLDAWGALEQADGYDIAVTARADVAQDNALFFVHLGGYDAAEFGELHHNAFVVAADAAAAKARALAQVDGWDAPHKDKLVAVDVALRHSGYGLKLTAAATPKPFRFTCQYLPLG
jgi:hypothetical protein